ncbi:MAG TPA: geranylgeranyl reductase family protein [Chloroflexota bacterium]
MRSRLRDVIVVGAGPGGSATAHFLSQRGLDVLLVDRAAFPRDKTCGDGLTPRALRVLERMSILAEVAAQGCRVEGYQVVAPNGRDTTAPIRTQHGALVVPRFKLDDIIVRRAQRSGAHLESRLTVSHLEPTPRGVRVHAHDGRVFDARVAVVATGAATGVPRRSGILTSQPRAMLAARTYFEGIPHDLERRFQLRFDGTPMPGYGWVFPTDRASANVGVGFLPGRHSSTATRAFDAFVAGRALQPLLRGAHQAGPLKGYPIRVDFLSAPTAGERTLLVGEAAGLVNPLTGEGIDYALECGMLAAEHVVHGLETGLDRAWSAEYDRLLRARWEKIFRFSEWIRDWYCKPLVLNLLVTLANRRPELRQLLASIVLGEREPRGFGPASMLVRLLAYLARHPGEAPAGIAE